MLCATAETLVCAGCTVYVGQIGGALLHLEDLPAGSNIARPQQLLAAGTAYSWRVDTHTIEGLKTGEIWSFTTGDSMACEITPHPPPRPAPPGPVKALLPPSDSSQSLSTCSSLPLVFGRSNVAC